MRLVKSTGKTSPSNSLNRVKSNPQLRGQKQNELEVDQDSHALLTVTILEATLNVDMSSFLQKMSTYCSVSL